MIYDSLQNIDAYAPLSGIYAGLKLLKETDFSQIPAGRYEVNENLFYMVQDYETKPCNDTPEAHRKFIDIQYLLSGEEYMDVMPLGCCYETVSANPDGDCWLYHATQAQRLKVSGDRFVVFFPGDGHAPGIAVETPIPCRKVVVKVRV